MIVAVKSHLRGPRVYVMGRRCHHGPAALLAAVACWRAGLRAPAVALGAWAWTDRRDFPFTDAQNH